MLESIVEKRPAKQALFAHIKPRLADRAILATNTSTIPIARLAAGLAVPGRFCGLHFCHPVRLRPLVEVIPGPATSPETMAAVVAHASSLGKLPLVVADGPGFVVNRLLLTYLNEALTMVTAGVPIQRIDAAMIEFGMPLGPLELLDEIGLDTALQSGIVLAEVFGERSAGSELLVRLVKAGQYGMKSGAGFYSYPEKMPNPSCGEITSSSGRIGLIGPIRPVNRRQPCRDRGVTAAADDRRGEKDTCGEKGLAPWQIDLAMIFGLGFPLWHGGVIWSEYFSFKDLPFCDKLQYADQ